MAEGVFSLVGDLRALSIAAGASLAAAAEGELCGMFSGLSALERLSVHAVGATNLFGQPEDLVPNGFRGCSFHQSLLSLTLQGLDLRRSIWSSQTFAGLTGLEELSVTGSAGNASFAISGDVFTPLLLLRKADLSGNGVRQLPGLSRSAVGALETLVLSGNPLEIVVSNPFANMFKLAEVTVDITTEC